jgi:NitT/TauT family transport system ATP-binding protein
MSGASAVVAISGLGKTFGNEGSQTVALSGIDLTIGPGEFVSLIGPSAPVLFDWRTIEANVGLPLEIIDMPKAQRAGRIAEMLALVELSDFARHHPWQLSGGMQQRAAIARALAFEPRLLLMDEPFGALDEMTRERMNTELLRIWEQTGTTIVFVTHSIPEAVFLSSRIVVMSARPGRITRIIGVDLPRPRSDATRELEQYFELITEVRESLKGGGLDVEHEPAPDERLEALP